MSRRSQPHTAAVYEDYRWPLHPTPTPEDEAWIRSATALIGVWK